MNPGNTEVGNVLSPERRFVLTLGVPDQLGIVAKLASFLAESGGSIVEAAHYSDPVSGWFFTRQEVVADSLVYGFEELRDRLSTLAQGLDSKAEFRLTDTEERKRLVILVSKAGHCLYDLLSRVASGELNVDVTAVIGNHLELADVTKAHGIPFHHVPFTAEPAQKREAFEEIKGIVDMYDPHTIALARFMQVVPPDLCEHWHGRALNIHHSFLPSFAGARPYHQAYERGVKLTGATCHFVTPDLDDGPIIEQDVTRVHHSESVDDIIRRGRDIEKIVLARGVRWHLEDRILVHKNRTAIFT